MQRDPTGIRARRRGTYVESPEQKRKEQAAFIGLVAVMVTCAGIGGVTYALTDSEFAGLGAFIGSGFLLGGLYALWASDYTDDESTW